MVSFLMRAHSLPVSKAAAMVGLILGGVGIIMTPCTGLLIERGRGRFPRIRTWLPAAGLIWSGCIFAVAYNVGPTAIAVAMLIAGSIGQHFYTPAMLTLAQDVAPPRIRATSAALMVRVVSTEADPPVHGEYRKALNSHFSAQKMFAMKDQLRERARALIDKFKNKCECDFIADFSEKYPIFIVLDLLGLPQDRMPEFLKWEKEMLHSNDWEVRGNGVRQVENYLLEEIEARRKEPRDDYISKVLTFEMSDRKWNADEVFGHCFNLYLGGLDTVTSLLGSIFQFLATHPDHQNELRTDRSRIVLAVEELLRAFAPVTPFRIVAKEIEICGQKVMPGEHVAVATPVIGRDPAFYPDPQEVRFDRKAPHMSLGGGIHRCLGMHLARLELQIAVEEFVTTLPEFRIKDGFKVPFYVGVGNILHIPDLKLQWN
jgi:cytochrome P450